MDDPSHKPGLLDRLSALLLREPEDREQLIELLHSAYERHLIDSDALSIIEGALAMSEMAVRDVMVPRAQMDMIDIEDPPESFIPFVLETAHSRFPVFEGERDKVLGILLAKDVLRFYAEENFDVREMLRPAVFVPESKRLNMLLAVLEKRCGFRLAAKDVFLNIAGGIKVDDPAIDLAVAMAILSSNADLAIDKTISFAAEIGLSGELRPVNRLEQRLGELEKLGYKKIIVSKYSKGIKGHKHQIEIIPCTKIEEVVRAVFA